MAVRNIETARFLARQLTRGDACLLAARDVSPSQRNDASADTPIHDEFLH